jgi:hypothetical protein
MTTRDILEFLFEKKGTSTAIGGAIGILTVYIAWSRGFLNRPNALVWGAAFIVFSALAGSLVDLYQSAKSEVVDNDA